MHYTHPLLQSNGVQVSSQLTLVNRLDPGPSPATLLWPYPLHPAPEAPPLVRGPDSAAEGLVEVSTGLVQVMQPTIQVSYSGGASREANEELDAG